MFRAFRGRSEEPRAVVNAEDDFDEADPYEGLRPASPLQSEYSQHPPSFRTEEDHSHDRVYPQRTITPFVQHHDDDASRLYDREGTPHYTAEGYNAVTDEKADLSLDGPEWNEKDENDPENDFGSPETFQGEFGAPGPDPIARRNHASRRVALTEGNLVLDCAIPSRLNTFLPRKTEDEFRYTRYSAVTCGPEDFDKRNYSLRQTLYNRETELMIVVTLYNENEVLFCRTLHGIMKNIAHLCSREKSKTWGPQGWKKVVVCLVADGRKAIHPRVLDCLSALGVYQDGLAKNLVDDKEVKAHVFEYTTQLSIDPTLKFKGLEKGIVPCQILFCLKEKKYCCFAKKLNSHRWALQAFAPQLNPNVCILLDAGTRPAPKAIYHLWKTFDLNSNVGGACGEISVMKGKAWMSLLSPLVAAQNFEYKISNILDKPLESVCGYISVLPGAFSAYRWLALKDDELGHGPLASYFKGENLAGYDADVFTSNMYLAEDRILCWELVAKRGDSWILKYVKSAVGETDVPTTYAEFISQRRRWLNGSFFASVYALSHITQIFGTDHSFWKKMVLCFQAIYNLLQLIFSWFAIGNFGIFFVVLTSSLANKEFGLGKISILNGFIQYAYAGTVIACFVMSLGNRPQGSKWKYITAIAIFGACTAYMIAAAMYCMVMLIKTGLQNAVFAQMIISLASTYGCYVAASVFALDPWHLLTSMVQYLLLTPTFTNLIQIYAFSNLHDITWGTRMVEQTEVNKDLGVAVSQGGAVNIVLPAGQSDIDGAYDEALTNLKTRPMIIPPPRSDAQKQEAIMDYYRNVRTNVLLAWVLSNALLVCTILGGDVSTTFSEGGNGRTQTYLLIILIFVALMSGIRFIGALMYLVMRMFGA